MSEYFDEEAKKLIRSGNDPLKFKGLTFTNSPGDSAQINKIQKGAVIISASGMCEAGRVKHHLKHNLWRKECSVVFVGYQAEGTLGRAISSGNKKVKIFGELVAVNASIYNLDGLSGHADQKGLMNWVEHLMKKPKEIYLVHGSDIAMNTFKELLDNKGYRSKIVDVAEKVYINEKIKLNDEIVKYRIMKLLNSIDDIENMSKEHLMKEIEEAIKPKIKE
jgi:metallo-beta-lactamase family protein